MNTEDLNTEDMSKDEYYLYAIISACENILDDLENGASIGQADFNNLGYVDGIMLRMQDNVNKQLIYEICYFPFIIFFKTSLNLITESELEFFNALNILFF